MTPYSPTLSPLISEEGETYVYIPSTSLIPFGVIVSPIYTDQALDRWYRGMSTWSREEVYDTLLDEDSFSVTHSPST